MRFLCWLIAAVVLGAEPNLYPEARGYLLEAAKELDSIANWEKREFLRGRIKTAFWNAGYVQDARRIELPAHRSATFVRTLKAVALYEGPEIALKEMEAFRGDASAVAGGWEMLAETLWRMGRTDLAGPALNRAEQALAKVPDPKVRAPRQKILAQLRQYLPEAPPIRLDATPRPARVANMPTASENLFPIAIEGYGPITPAQAAERQKENGPFLEKLYRFLAAQDLRGAFAHASAATSRWQRTVGLATFQHLAMEGQNWKFAREAASVIPEDLGECSLAKADALGMLAFAEKGADTEAAFEEAAETLQGVGPEWRLARIRVLTGLGRKAALAGRREMARRFFAEATELIGPKPPFQYFDVMAKQVEVKEFEGARETAARWYVRYPAGAESSVVIIWLRAGEKDEAVRFVQGMKTPAERSAGLTSIGEDLLRIAGAPSL